MKVIHMPTELGMRGYTFKKVENELGIDSKIIVRRPGIHDTYSIDFLYSPSKLLYSWNIVAGFLETLQADIIMANCGSSLMDFNTHGLNLLDIPIYKALKKRIIVTFQGCDIRQCNNCEVRIHIPGNEICPNVPSGSNYKEYDMVKMTRFEKWRLYSDRMLGITPDLCMIEGIEYTPHVRLIDEMPCKIVSPINNKIRIAHMPRGILKGTKIIYNVISDLSRKYPGKLELISIENYSWKKSLELLSTCDIVIDQMLVSWYGGISVEAAMIGVLPIAKINDKYLQNIPEQMRQELPVLKISDSSELKELLKELINNKNLIQDLALLCKRNAFKWHDARSVIKNIVKNYYLAP